MKTAHKLLWAVFKFIIGCVVWAKVCETFQLGGWGAFFGGFVIAWLVQPDFTTLDEEDDDEDLYEGR